jgi:hypothetical protein
LSTGGHRPRLRTLREERSFAECLDRLGEDRRYWDEVLGHLRWKLARDAEGCSFALVGRKTRLTFTEELRRVPVLRVFFWIEGDMVVLAWAEKVDDAPPFGFDDWLE